MANKPAFDMDKRKILWTMPTIAEQLPIKFNNNKSWRKFSGQCVECNQPIPDDMLRGQIMRPVHHTAVIEAIGYCKVCNLITCYDYRMHEGERFSGKVNGEWRTWYPTDKVVKKQSFRSIMDDINYTMKLIYTIA